MINLYTFADILTDGKELMIDYESLYKGFVRGQMMPFYTLMYPGLLTFASRMLGPSLAFMAEDCVQDAVMSTYEHRDDLEDAWHWRWYLMRSVRSKVSNMLRHKGVSDGYVTDAGTRDELEEVERDISYELIRQETLDRLFAAIDSLPEQYREIFELNFEQGLKNQEIARLLDVAEITVKKRKARMIEMLRGLLGADTDMLLALYLMSRLANVS